MNNLSFNPYGLKDGELSSGTTIMAVTFDGGVVLGMEASLPKHVCRTFSVCMCQSLRPHPRLPVTCPPPPPMPNPPQAPTPVHQPAPTLPTEYPTRC